MTDERIHAPVIHDASQIGLLQVLRPCLIITNYEYNGKNIPGTWYFVLRSIYYQDGFYDFNVILHAAGRPGGLLVVALECY